MRLDKSIILMKGRLKEVLKHYLMFSITCSAGTVVDLGVHWLLSTTVLAFSYWARFWVSPFISFELATITNFIIAYHYVWRERISDKSSRSFWRHFAAFNATSFGAFLLKFGIMQGAHFLLVSMNWLQSASYEPALCNFIGMLFSGTFSFFMNEFVIFGKKSKKSRNGLQDQTKC